MGAGHARPTGCRTIPPLTARRKQREAGRQVICDCYCSACRSVPHVPHGEERHRYVAHEQVRDAEGRDRKIRSRALAIAGTTTLPAGHAEIELKSRYAQNPTNESSRLAGIVSVGIAPGLQAAVESRLLLVEPDGAAVRGGFGDTFVELKHRLLDEGKTLPGAALVPAVRFPTGSPERGLGATGYEAGVLVALSKTVRETTITGNAGWSSVTAEDETASDTWTLAGAVEHRLTPRWTLLGESVNAIGTRNADTAIMRVGTSWAASPAVTLSIAAAAGLTPRSPDVIVTVGVTIGLF